MEEAPCKGTRKKEKLEDEEGGGQKLEQTLEAVLEERSVEEKQ